MNRFGSFGVVLPPWVDRIVEWHQRLQSDDAIMQLVHQLALKNRIQHTGGPHAAVLIQRSEGRIVSVGVDMVHATHVPIAHAPLIAIIRGCQIEGQENLRNGAHGGYTLFCSSNLCPSCALAVVRAGVESVVIGVAEAKPHHRSKRHEATPELSGLELLRTHGVTVTDGPWRAELQQLIDDADGEDPGCLASLTSDG